MSESLPFMNSTGLVSKIFTKIIEAQTPPKYTQDFQANKLGYGSGSAKPFIPLLKRIGFISSDGTPTDLYKKFRNSSSRGVAMAEAIKKGYSPLYAVSEYAHDLDQKKLKDAIIQVTGHSSDSGTVKAISGTFAALKNYANFEQNSEDVEIEEKDVGVERLNGSGHESRVPMMANVELPISQQAARGMNLSYTINLNLPETKDPEVFDAIFTSLKSKLLS